MSGANLGEQEIVRLTRFADILMPATKKLPAPGALPSYGQLANSAFAASGFTPEEVREALAALPAHLDWEGVKSFAAGHPAQFDVLALLASGAYVMAPEILETLGFPADRRNPAGTMEAADEYETGILEPVISRGPCYRDPRTT